MPKVKNVFKIIAYTSTGEVFGTNTYKSYTYAEAFDFYLGIIKLVTEGELSNIFRLEFVSGTRILFSFCSLRSIVNQNNFTINFKPM